MITPDISFVTIFPKSTNASCNTLPSIYASPRPITKESNKAVITSINGGIATVKYG